MEQMKKVVILGCKGMAGHVVKSYLESTGNFDVWGIARGITSGEKVINLDVSNTKELEGIFNKGNFDVVVNCIGLLNKTAEDNPELAVWFNSYFPQLLASYGLKYNFKLLHISTDCVFSGKEGGYTETSFKNGIGFYAQSKALGEVISTKDLTFRTSIIGPELKENGIGLFHWFMNQEIAINGFTAAIWSGITTLELAKGIVWAIEDNITGLYHLTNNLSINKYDLLSLFKKETNKQIEITEVNGKKVDKSFIDTRKLINYKIPDYEIMIREMVALIKKNAHQYKHYNI
jgi:dTDP-4-dehydrorhamnose reductase